MLHDLNSANGTYVNWAKVSSTAELKQGDQIKCGSTLIVFGGEPSGISGEPGGSLKIDENGNIIESAIMATVPSMEDSVIIAGPEASSAVENLRILYDLSIAISSIFDRHQLLERVMDIIRELGDETENRDVKLQDVINKAIEEGMNEALVRDTIQKLKNEGNLYEPRMGYIRPPT